MTDVIPASGVHIREVDGSSPFAPIYDTLVYKSGCFSFIWA